MKSILLMIIALIISFSVNAQTINVHKINGEIERYNSSEVEFIDFSASDSVPVILMVSMDSLSFNSSGGSDQLSITCNYQWTASSSQTWCSVSPDSGSDSGNLNITVTENSSIDSRIAILKVMAGTLTEIVQVTQKGKSTKAKDYCELFNGTIGEVESFIFFSDSHWCDNYSNATTVNAEKHLQTIKQHFDETPTKFVLCGGDWLTSHKQSVAIQYLAKIDSIMDKMFPECYYPILGNHDTNYLGELDTTNDTSANDGRLSNQQIVDLWFMEYGNAYYTFEGENTSFYVFDSGIDWNVAMNSYEWEQVDWFANQLLKNVNDNIILATHIAELNYKDPAQFSNRITPVINNVLLVAEAFNGRNKISLNGQTYDFSHAAGKIRCMLCGHVHFDANSIIHGIPLLCIDDAKDENFDLILVDYAANRLKTIRVGSGDNRTISLAK
jgi:hypothetical protein